MKKVEEVGERDAPHILHCPLRLLTVCVFASFESFRESDLTVSGGSRCIILESRIAEGQTRRVRVDDEFCFCLCSSDGLTNEFSRGRDMENV